MGQALTQPYKSFTEDSASVLEQARSAVAALQGLVARLQVTARFMETEMFMARICEAAQRGMERNASDNLRPESAAVFADCSPSFIYQMMDEGVIHRKGGANMPIVSRAEIQAAIDEGRWCSKSGKRKSESEKQSPQRRRGSEVGA